MIHHELFGQHLRLGNFLFQMAATTALCKKHTCKTIYPDYYLWKYLENPPVIYTNDNKWIDELIRPRKWEWTQEEQDWLDTFGQDFREKNVEFALNFFFQSYKWFEGYEREVYNSLKIKQEETDLVYAKYEHIFNRAGRVDIPTIGISVRLGDFIGHGDFYQISPEWYIKALEQFPTWRERPVVIFSDDIEKAKKLFKDYPFYYAEPNGTHTHADNFKHYHSEKAAEQFILGTLMNDWIIGNSTFSWWMAWLATYNKPYNKVVHCGEVFRGKAKEQRDITHYYHKDWIKIEV